MGLIQPQLYYDRSEFLGLAGMVTLNNSETDGFNRVPTLDVSQVVTQDVIDGGKRTTTGANRSLPDIPKDKSKEHEDVVSSIPQGIYETTETMRDHSELYATVQDAVQEQISERETQEIIQQSSLIQDTSHQYARFTSSISDNIEHPYAQLQNFQKTEINQVNRNNVNQVTNIENPSTSTSQLGGNPIAPPRTRRSSSHNSLLNSELHSDIQAANAIRGNIQANQDLPYMTPPVLMLLPHSSQSQHNSLQQHFSGDSQDSKGYTSISVREPLANIIAQTKAAYRQNQSTRPIIDSHYTTVSDDSDEMYAAIDEQDKVYTSGSETYAQIQPMMSEVQRHAQHEQTIFCQPLLRTEETYSAPQPPSVDSLRYVAHAHSRQASSSSANSSIINPGSPKPEKRQANSPLPPPPEATAEGYAIVDKKSKGDDRSRSSLSMGKSLEDMYAKVMKKRKEVEEQQNDTHSNSTNVPHSETNTCRKLSLEVSRASWCSHESVEIQKKEPDLTYYSVTSSNTNNFHVENDNNTLRLSKVDTDAAHLKIDHEYETVNSNNSKRNSIARGDTHTSDLNYNILRSQCSREIDFQSTSRNSMDAYSTSFKHRQISNASSEDPGYEKVRLRRRVELDQDTDSEPNYESMPHDTVEPNYASVCQPGDSDTDPNYESVSHGDPNYESVRYMSVTQNEEPPYEQVNNVLSDANADGYEKIKDKKMMSVNYEKIDLNLSLEQINNRGDTDDGQYIQV
ncbi:dentin sialophospho isoform x2 [Lasius niger]|uniref:Dentin sialophospho isoform x2 n=1 Tax=Lasius niger TaxID=67767 RepID=A0A0J7KIN1_LASNI|nr:dentin sialophospho isoform x2 [Lasius niger]